MFSSLNAGALKLALPLDETLRLAHEAGFSALDLPMEALLALAGESSPQAVQDHFAGAGVRPGSWGLAVNFRADDDTYRQGLQQLPRYAALAQALGSPWCTTWILPFSDSLPYAENMQRHAERLQPVGRILADHGCRFGLEFVGPATLRTGHTHSFIHTIDGALELARHIGTGNVGLLLDCYHWYTAHGTIQDLATLNAADIVSVHLNDAVPGRDIDQQLDQERMLPGAGGLIDLTGFLQALARMGYDGPVAVEPFSAEVNALPAEARVRAAAQSLQAVFAQAGLPRP